ncbi:hypothetical protein V1511DRAFT_107768 [Dipodascopsis uninucleata]
MSFLDPVLQAVAINALADLSRAGLSYHDLVSYGDINPLFLAALASTIQQSTSLVSSPPTAAVPAVTSNSSSIGNYSSVNATGTSSGALPSNSNLPLLSGQGISNDDRKDNSPDPEASAALIQLACAGLSYDDMVKLGGVHPIYLAQLILQMSSSLPNTKLLEEAVIAMQATAAATAVNATSSNVVPELTTLNDDKSVVARHSQTTGQASVLSATAPSSSSPPPKPLNSLGSLSHSHKQATATNKTSYNGLPVLNFKAAEIKHTQESDAQRSSRTIINGHSITLKNTTSSIQSTTRRRPTAMELDKRPTATLKFGSDRSNGPLIIQMSDSEDSEEE